MSDHSRLVREGDALYLLGQINFQTVSGLYQSFRNELNQPVNTLDCSKVEQCDSSAISLLLASRSLAETRQIRLHIRGMNDQMLSLARLYEVESLLN